MLSTRTEKLVAIKEMLGITDTDEDAMICTYLDVAEMEILAWKYNDSGIFPDSLPDRDCSLQINAVIAGYTHRGSEGQTESIENSVTRNFNRGDMLEYIHANCSVMVRL